MQFPAVLKKFGVTLFILTIMGLTSGCDRVLGDKDSSGNGEADIINGVGWGCVQGVMLDGLSGQRVEIPDDEYQGVFVLVRNRLLRANPHVLEAEGIDGRKHLVGEYYLCGVPLDEEFPVFAWLDGYMDYEGTVTVSSTIAHQTPNVDTGDIPLTHPTSLVNVTMFPVGTETADLRLVVYYEGVPVEGAQVQLKPTGNNIVRSDRRVADQPRLVPMLAETGPNGEVIFPKSDLALGGEYEYTVVPPSVDAYTSMGIKSGTLVVGLRRGGTELADAPFTVSVALDIVDTDLRMLAKSWEFTGFDSEGRVVIKFDRPIEIVPGSADFMTASLTGAVEASLHEDKPGNNRSDSVKFEIDGDKLILTPLWAVVPDINKEPGIKVNYNGVVVRAVGETVRERYLAVTGAGIHVFDGN